MIRGWPGWLQKAAGGLAAVSAVSTGLAWGDAGLMLTVAGLGITSFGVVLAVAIYDRQRGEAASSEARVVGHLKHISAGIVHAAEEQSTGSPDDDDDAYPQEADVLARYGQVADAQGNIRFLEAGRVPLTLIADVVEHWRAVGDAGTWDLDRVVAAVRRTGRGNHPWIIVFRSRDDETLRAWKVSRGGQGKRAPTVTEVEGL